MAPHLIESGKPDLGLAPLADAAGRTGLYTRCGDSEAVFVYFAITQGNAAPVPCSILQAKNAAGLDAKAIPAVPVYVNQAVAASDAMVREAVDANAFTTSATLANKLVGFFVPTSALDKANDFAFIAGRTGASNAANVTCVFYQHVGLRYAGLPTPTLRS